MLAIDCAGGVRVITSHAPAMEGGIAVAPAWFGRYGGDLVAPGETSGPVFAIGPDDSVVTLVVSGLPRGDDSGERRLRAARIQRRRRRVSRRPVLQGQQAPGHRQHHAPAGRGADQRR